MGKKTVVSQMTIIEYAQTRLKEAGEFRIVDLTVEQAMSIKAMMSAVKAHIQKFNFPELTKCVELLTTMIDKLKEDLAREDITCDFCGAETEGKCSGCGATVCENCVTVHHEDIRITEENCPTCYETRRKI